MSRSGIVSAIISVISLSLLSSDGAQAVNRYRQTGCEWRELDGVLRPHVTFELSLEKDSYPYVCFFLMVPQNIGASTDTCKFLGSTAVGWFTGVGPTIAVWQPKVSCLEPGTTHSGFELVLDRASCCFDAYFQDELFFRFGHEVVCFECDPPVPSRLTTWGTVKSSYR